MTALGNVFGRAGEDAIMRAGYAGMIMKSFCVVAVGMAIAALLGVPATAQNTQQMVGSILITFPIPAAQCEITGRTPAQALKSKKIRDFYGDATTVLLMHTDCTQLDSLSGADDVLTEYTEYAMPTLAIDKFITPESAAQICADKKKEAAAKSFEKETQETNDQSASGIKFTAPKFLGVLLEENNTCYTGAVARVTTEAYRDMDRIGIFALVLVKGKLIGYRTVGLFRDSQSVTELLTKHKANVAAFIAANKE